MIPKLQGLLEEIRELEKKVADEITREAGEFGYTVRQGRVSFEQEIAHRHRQMATRIGAYLADAPLLFLLTAPIIYSLILPLLLLDIFVWIYQLICFPVYRIPKVKRSDFIVLDLHHLQYLNRIERFNCSYCSYANGLIAYTREVAARSEQYWCPIKHARKIRAPHSHYYNFLSYGDCEDYSARLEELRQKFTEESRNKENR